MSYSSDLDELMAARRKKKDDGEGSSKGVAIGRIDVKKVAVPASSVVKLPDGTTIVRGIKDDK